MSLLLAHLLSCAGSHRTHPSPGAVLCEQIRRVHPTHARNPYSGMDIDATPEGVDYIHGAHLPAMVRTTSPKTIELRLLLHASHP